jgi:hypothetical protein
MIAYNPAKVARLSDLPNITQEFHGRNVIFMVEREAGTSA